MAPQPLIEIRDLVFGYPRGTPRPACDAPRPFALHLPDLDIAPGERVACIGPSGSGKTTLVHLVAGILTPSGGSIRVVGTDIASLDDRQRRAFRLKEVGMVFQEFELLEHLTALDNILLPAIIRRGAPAPAERERARALASAVGIDHTLARKPRKLSQGERQRVGICRALSTSPRLLLCDEPTGNLDPRSTHVILDLVLAQARERSMTLLMVTHNHTILDRFDRVIDMERLAADAGAAP